MTQYFLILYCLFQGFIQKWDFPQGIDWGAGRLCLSDSDRDGNCEFVFTTYGGLFTINVWELHLPNTWTVDSFPYVNSPILWDADDFDRDGLIDLIFQASAGPPNLLVSIAESPDSFSYPIQEVWRDTVGFALVQPISTYDVDRDSFPEILYNNGNGQPHYFWIFEAIGDNQYDTVFTTNPDSLLNDEPSSTHAFGDFDTDGRNEFVMGGMSGTYWIYESPAHNVFEKVNEGLLPTANIRDCFMVPDADGNGKIEFVVKGYTPLDARIQAFIFEAIADNTYQIIKSFDLTGGDYYGGYSDASDVDGDSVPEIVLESAGYVYLIKSAGNDSFYVWDTLPGNASGSSIRVTSDIDQNGLNEIVISGNNETRIYEYVPEGISERSAGNIKRIAEMRISPNPFHKNLKIKINIPYTVLENHTKLELSLKIYSISGCLVKQWDDSILEKQNLIVWSGTDQKNRPLPSGIYYIYLEYNDRKCGEKVLLIR